MNKDMKHFLRELRQEVISLVPEGQAHYGLFITLKQIQEALKPILDESGAIIYHEPTYVMAGDTVVPFLKTTLAKVDSDEELTSMIKLEYRPNDPQSQGSALTYTKRYALLTMLNIVPSETDDDGVSDMEVPLQKRMSEKDLLEVGHLLTEKGIASKADKVKIIELLGGKKAMNTSAINRLKKAIKEATTDTLQEIVLRGEIL